MRVSQALVSVALPSIFLGSCTAILGVDGNYQADGSGGAATTSTSTASGSATAIAGSGTSSAGTSSDATTVTGGAGGGGGEGGRGQGGGCPDGMACFGEVTTAADGASAVRLASSPWAGTPTVALLSRLADGSQLDGLLGGTSGTTLIESANEPAWAAAPFAGDGEYGYALASAGTIDLMDPEHQSVIRAPIVGTAPLVAAGGTGRTFLLSALAPGVPSHVKDIKGSVTVWDNICTIGARDPVLFDLASSGESWLAAVVCEDGVVAQHGPPGDELIIGGAAGVTGVAVGASDTFGAIVVERVEGETSLEVVGTRVGEPWTRTQGSLTLPGHSPAVAVSGSRAVLAYRVGAQIHLRLCRVVDDDIECHTLTPTPSSVVGIRPSIAFDGDVYWLAWVDAGTSKYASFSIAGP